MFVVIVTREYPPSLGVGGARMYWLASGLARLGHRVLVVTAEPSPELGSVEVVAVPFVSAGTAAKRLAGIPASQNAADLAAQRGRAVETLVRWSAKTLERTVLHPDKYRAWIRACEEWLAQNRSLVASADVIIASTPPVSAAFAGEKLARPGSTPLILDFRDPWTGNRHYPFGPIRRALDRRAERRLCSRASAIVVASDAFADKVITPKSLSATVVRTVPPARGDYRPAPPYGSGVPFRLAFYGLTYEGQRDLRPVIRAVENLVASGRVAPDEIEIELAGALDATLLRAISESPAGAVTRILGTVPKGVIDARLADVHLALCPMWPGDTDMLPLKAVEHLSAGREILVTGAAMDSEIRAVLASVNGVTFADTEQAIAAALHGTFTRWREGESLYYPAGGRAPWLSHAAFVERFAELLLTAQKRQP